MLHHPIRRPPTLIVTAALVAACHSAPSDGSGDIEVRDSAGVRVVRSGHALDGGGWRVSSQPRLRIESPEDGAQWVIHWIRGARRLSDGRIVILSESARQLLFFGGDGGYLFSASREGDGPGELRGPFLLDVLPGDTLVVSDRRTGRQTRFFGDGEFLSSDSPDRTILQDVVPDSHSVGFPQFLAPGFIFAAAHPRGLGEVGRRIRRSMYFVVAGPEFGSPRRIGPFGAMEQFALSERNGRWASFANRTASAFGGTPPRLYLGDSESGEISVYDLDGELVSLIRDSQPPPPITDRDIEWERWELLDWGAQSDRLEEFTRLADAMPIPKAKPAFESLIVDRLGFLWVKEYSSYWPGPVTHRIYAPSGERVGTATLPGRLTVFDIGPDYVLGVYSDTNYVESVFMYDLTRPKGD